MILLNEIKKALTRRLDRHFPDMHIVTEDVEQLAGTGGTAFPLLHVQLEPMGSSLAMGADTKDKAVLVDITFMEASKSRNETIYEVRDRMEEALGDGIAVCGRYLHIQTVGSTVADDLLHVTATLEYNDDYPKGQEPYDLFGQITVDI